MADSPSVLPADADIPLDSATTPPELEAEPSPPAGDPPSAKPHLFVVRLVSIVGATFLCPVLVHFGHRYGLLLWGNLHFVNFIVAWIPAVLSILVAFVPDKELATRMRVLWRISVIVCGLLYSATLWHQQTLADAQNDQQIQKAVNEAVDKANKHSDDQFGKVQDNVGGVDKKVTAVGDTLTQTATALSSDIQRTSDAIQKTSDRLDASIGKVGKPDPIPPPKFAFTLTDTIPTSGEPVRSEVIHPNEDGTYSFKFNIINTSDVSADEVEMWLTICHACEFVGEPKGSDHPSGERPQMRHFVLGSMHAGVAHGDTVVTFKPKPDAWPPFGVTFAYACKTCGKPHNEPDYILNVDPSSKVPRPQQ